MTIQDKRTTWAQVHIDAMRGAAALIVALGHARSLFFASVTGVSDAGQLTIGDEAVMVFFVLSGYLVGGSVIRDMGRHRWSWSNYLLKRLVRLWIVLIPAVFLGIAIDAIGFHFLAANGSIYSAPAGQTYVQTILSDQIKSIPIIIGNLFFLQTIVVPTVGTNSALWSLSNEFWYYLLFPMGMLAVRYERRLARRLAYAFGIVCIVGLIGAHAAFLFLPWLLGAGLAVVPRLIPAERANKVVSIAAVVFCVCFLEIKKLHLPLYVGEAAVALLVGALLYAIICQRTPQRPSLYGWVARWSSNLSYSLYLTHLPFLILICALIDTPWTLSALNAAVFAKFGIGMMGALALACLIYYAFESRTDRTRDVIRGVFGKPRGGREEAVAGE
ncbi:acyltransferase [Robbsia sp. KACC 23696]|uniref:acyltransferase family protein n=1 Tax=Robbsia sp. KACC 23696 TaxID=3149231 RepID=UPI00325A589C